jgi:hypothetical protein
MNERLTVPTHPLMNPVAAILIVVAFAATLALGFGLRAWTERPAVTVTPTAAVAHPRADVPQPLVRMGRPR